MDVAAVRSIFPGAVGMKAQTGFGLIAGASAMLLLAGEIAGPRHSAVLALAAFPGILGLGVLIEYVFGVHLGTDELVFVDHAGRARAIAHPGRFAPTTAVCFVLLTGALLSLDHGRAWRWRPTELFAIPMGVVASMSVIGYAYSIPAFYGPASAAKMAVNTALCFIALALALLVARPRGRFLELATTTDPGGVMVRRVVPLCLVAPLLLGWLHLRTVGWGVFDDRVGTWWLAATTVAGLVAMMWWCAGTLSRADRERRALEAQLYELWPGRARGLREPPGRRGSDRPPSRRRRSPSMRQPAPPARRAARRRRRHPAVARREPSAGARALDRRPRRCVARSSRRGRGLGRAVLRACRPPDGQATSLGDARASPDRSLEGTSAIRRFGRCGVHACLPAASRSPAGAPATRRGRAL